MASLVDRILPGREMKPPDTAIPPKVKKRCGAGREEMKRKAPQRRLCARFERGDVYWYIDTQGQLNFQSTAVGPGGKPNFRMRLKLNFVRPIVTSKVSASTQRTPGFEVVPSTTDQKRISAAELAGKVANAGYDKWRLHDVDVQCSLKAIGHGGEAFAFPYFDPNVAPFHQAVGEDGQPAFDEKTGDPVMIGEGELKVLVLGGNEAYWEPGCSFMESRWHAIERARLIDEIQDMPGFFGGELKPDAATSDIPTDVKPDNMVIVTEYFERPCPKYPEGRHLVMANGRQVVPERIYPLRTKAGKVIDEPVLHRLAWDTDDGSFRDLGLTWQLIDAQRVRLDCINKAGEWKNRALQPQWWARVNSVIGRRTEDPGAINYYQGDQRPEQEDVKPIPDSLFRLHDLAAQSMREIGFDTQLEAAPDVAAKTVQAVIEQQQLQWAGFLIHKADWWSRLMRHCLTIVAANYDEPRLLTYRGLDGWEHVSDFEGAHLMDEVDVRVFPHSLVALTRDGVRDQIDWLVTRFPGWLNPQDALAALQAGSLDRLTQTYWLDVARAHTAIQKITDGSSTSMPTMGETNPLTGEPTIDPATGEQLKMPQWMPSMRDNLEVWDRAFSDWMKTDAYAALTPDKQEQGQLVWDGIQRLKTMQAQMKAAQTQMMAENAGMTNAAAPPQPKPMPSLPGSNLPAQQ